MQRHSRPTRAAAAFVLCLLVFVRLWHTSAPEHPDVAIYSYEGRNDWADFASMHNLDQLDDSRIVSRGVTVPIGVAHAEGLFHRGLWLAVAKRGQHGDEILLLHRSMSMKTCPGAWGLVGEHSNPEEPWRTTAARALREELGLSVKNDDPGLVNLALGTSYLVKVAYDDVNRRDLQATALFFYRVPGGAKLQYDGEVAGTRWVAPRELKKLEFCNAEITSLARVVAELIHRRAAPPQLELDGVLQRRPDGYCSITVTRINWNDGGPASVLPTDLDVRESEEINSARRRLFEHFVPLANRSLFKLPTHHGEKLRPHLTYLPAPPALADGTHFSFRLEATAEIGRRGNVRVQAVHVRPPVVTRRLTLTVADAALSGLRG